RCGVDGFGGGEPESMQDVHGTMGTHDGDLRGGPGQIGVGTEVLGSHDVVGTAEGLAGDHGDQRNGRLGVCVQELGATADDAVPFLVGSGEETGHVHEGQDGNVECGTGAYEAGGALGGVAVPATCTAHRAAA